MRADAAMLALHGGAIMLALTAALVWPRVGQAAVLVPLGRQDVAQVLRWAEREQAERIALDPASGRVVARVNDHRSLLRAIGAGIIPIAASAAGCSTTEPPR
jgi:hypothetical protein